MPILSFQIGRARAFAILVVILLAIGCPAPVSPPPSTVYDVDIEAYCATSPAWTAGSPAFVDATDAWGLRDLEVFGTRIAVLDLDGDAFPDLFVRRGGIRANDFTPGGTRGSWLLKNTGTTFYDVTEASGIDVARGGASARPYEVVAFADVDNDGDTDIFTGLTAVDIGVTGGETS